MIDVAPLLPQIERVISDELAANKTPGLVVGIVQGGRLLLGKGYGLADIVENLPITTRSVMRWGSISKLFTCIGIFQQWERGRFRLGDPVNKYLQKGKLVPKKGTWPEATVQHLLTHTAGIGEIRRGADLLVRGFRLLTYDDKPVPPLSSLHELDLPLSAPPGLKYAYSNIGGSLLGFLTEIFSGQDFQQYMIEKIFTPLGMEHSDFDRSPRVDGLAARGYKRKRGRFVPARAWNNIIKPSGGLAATLEDMARFASCLLARGKSNGGRLLEPGTLDLIWAPHYWAHDAFKDDDALGYIFRLQKLNGKRIVWHTGGLSGFTSTFDLLPDEDVALLTCANVSESLHERITLRLRHRILKILCGAEHPPALTGRVPETSLWPQMKGYYGGWPGWLSNTRIITSGIDFKVSEKRGHLILSSLFGKHKSGTKLYQTHDPLVYEYPVNEGDDIGYMSRIGFTHDKSRNKIVGLALGDQTTLHKNPLHDTFRCKLVSALAGAAIIVSFLVAFDAIRAW